MTDKLEQYYITATLSRKPVGKESSEIIVPGYIFAGRMKAVVTAETWQDAMEIGKKMITGCLKKGITPIDWGWMPVKDAEKLGDTEMYGKYSTATWLCYYRLKAGLTQAQLAKLSGVNERQIQRVEIGEAEAGNLTARNLLAIADAIGVDPRLLI